MTTDSNTTIDQWADNSEYRWGFETNIESDTLPPGLNENVVRSISKRKHEPDWLLQWRLEAFAKWKKMADHLCRINAQ